MLLATLLAAAAWTAPAPLELPDHGATASGRVRRERRSAVSSRRRPRSRGAAATGSAPFTPITAPRTGTSSSGRPSSPTRARRSS